MTGPECSRQYPRPRRLERPSTLPCRPLRLRPRATCPAQTTDTQFQRCNRRSRYDRPTFPLLPLSRNRHAQTGFPFKFPSVAQSLYTAPHGPRGSRTVSCRAIHRNHLVVETRHTPAVPLLPLARHFLSIPFFRRRTISRKPHPGLYNRRQWMPPARLPRLLHHPQLIDIPDPHYPHFVRPWSADKEMTFLPNPFPVLPIRAAQPLNQLRRLHARSLAKHVNLAEPLTDRGTIPFCPFLGRTHLQFLRSTSRTPLRLQHPPQPLRPPPRSARTAS